MSNELLKIQCGWVLRECEGAPGQVRVADADMPRPSEPNSGFTTTSPPSRVKASIASSACWQQWSAAPAARRPPGERWRDTCRCRFQRPWAVKDDHAVGLPALEHVHAEDDLFQRPGRMVRTITAGLAQKVRGSGQRRPEDGGSQALRLCGPGQTRHGAVADVPAFAAGNYCDSHELVYRGGPASRIAFNTSLA